MFTKATKHSKAAVNTSYVLSELIAKHYYKEYILYYVNKYLKKYNLPLLKLTSIKTDKAPSMTEKINGFVAYPNLQITYIPKLVLF